MLIKLTSGEVTGRLAVQVTIDLQCSNISCIYTSVMQTDSMGVLSRCLESMQKLTI